MSKLSVKPFLRSSIAKKAAVLSCVAFAYGMTGFMAPSEGSGTKMSGPSAYHHGLLRVIAFGSSSTEGVGASGPSASYPAQLQVILAKSMPKGRTVEVLNRGIGGQDVDDMMVRLQSDVLQPKPDVVIWQTGSNDPMRNVPIDRFETETRKGILAMRQAGAEVILMEPQWCPRLEKTANANQFRDVVRRLGEELKVPVIRRSDLMHKWIADGQMTPTQMLAPDGLHMTDSGYAALAKEMAPEVLKASAMASAFPVVQAH